MAEPVVLLAPGVARIPTMGDFVNSFLFLDEDGQVTLVDCGYRNASSRIVAALTHLGKHPSDVTRIVLTHAHSDHAGAAQAMVDQTDIAGVDIHSEDVPYAVEGRNAPPDLSTSSGRVLSRLPGTTFDPVSVAHELADGEVIDVAGGLRVVHTPGHTPGHISLVHEGSGVLITGDSLFNPFGRVRWPFGALCTSAEQNRRSAQLLADLPYTLAAFTHGPEIRERPREAIQSFLRAHS